MHGKIFCALTKNGENSKVHPDTEGALLRNRNEPGEGGVYKLLVNTLKKAMQGLRCGVFSV